MRHASNRALVEAAAAAADERASALKPAHEQIADIAALLKDQARWTQGALARDATGREVMPISKPACRWDLRGACFHVCRVWVRDKGAASDRCRYLQLTIDKAAHMAWRRSAEGVNDGLGHGAVIETLRTAYAMAKARPPKEDAFGARDDR